MEVAILRVRESVVCEGDFGLAGVVIGYTYQWLFLPLPYIRLKLSFGPLFPSHPAPTPSLSAAPERDYISDMSEE